MDNSEEPQFPFRMSWIQTGEIEVYENIKELVCNLEDFDTGVDGHEASVTDALGRKVHLVVKIGSNQCDFRFLNE